MFILEMTEKMNTRFVYSRHDGLIRKPLKGAIKRCLTYLLIYIFYK